jgi:L-histidine Nalpha-methyltransferase / hercynylcysteine S-oxide synthase
MHLETFLYMLLQSERVLAPPGHELPDFKALAAAAKMGRIPNKWNRVPTATITLGLDDPETDVGPDRYFGWDNERPPYSATVPEFEAQSRPISNGEYAHFLEATNRETLPASWTVSKITATTNGVTSTNGHTNGHANGHGTHELEMASATFVEAKAIKTVYGLIPLKYALDWPVMASYDELAAYAEWSDGRIPTLEEARSLYQYVEEQRSILQKVPSKLISAVNG